jgi:sporulation integral membrane protein YlbJ
VGELDLTILFYLLILSIILLLVYFRKDKNIVITIACTLLILQIIIAPKVCIDAAIAGSLLFFYKVFPSLFSFLVVSNIMLSYDGVYIYSKFLGGALCRPLKLPSSCSFVLIVSILCGYPLGAKYASDIYERKIIDFPTYERLLNIASNASPLFILGSIGISMLKNPYIGYMLLLSNLLSCLIMGLIIPSKVIVRQQTLQKSHILNSSNIGDVLKGSIENSIKTSLSIGGYVTLFSVIDNLLKNNYIFNVFTDKMVYLFHLSKEVTEGVTLGIIEMTNGCSLISSSNVSILTKIAITSFLFTFSGLSIISQVYSFTYKFDISMKKYVVKKFFQGLICSVISILLYELFLSNSTIQTFASEHYAHIDVKNIFLWVFMLLIIPWLSFRTKKLFHIS